MGKTEASILMETHLDELMADSIIDRWEAERLVTPKRKWRFDYTLNKGQGFNTKRLAIEIEGGVWTGGRHTRGKGFIGDIEKYNAATLNGWPLLRFTPEMVMTGVALETIKKYLER